MLLLLVPSFLEEAYAATQTKEISETGISQTAITIQVGDSIRFLNTDVVDANGNLEPHCISDPESIAFTEESCWIIDNTETSRTWNSGELIFGSTGTD